ncbi:LOW QUALITY PROTEIN: G-protein coupled receptor 55 [Kryptolebias marmoratus]|uniref:LOW QUALITY PROTEIN: G-protein coupled receptor 55 n=1 Tax=Kryptolebias marmoratus TaxID=37003 RepID=UPI0007F92400|nr:LOW QUALITY PROTEIN: G-protein coupled receptor 55 [Kryptolebias marmoratus]
MRGMTQEVVMKQQKVEKQKVSGTAQTVRNTVKSSETVMGDNTTNTSCSAQFSADALMEVLEPVIYVPIFIVGLLLNVAALLVFCVCLRKWTESTIYMTSLALMDLLLLLPLPSKMHAAKNLWSSELRPLCSFLENLYFVGTYGSIYMITCIAVDRWGAICHPFRAKQLRSPRAALVTCVGVWLLVFSTIFPVTYNFRQGEKEPFRCFHEFSEKGWSAAVISCVLLFGFLGPATVVVLCSVHTIRALQQSGQTSPKSRACVKIISSSLVAFLVPFTPSHLGVFLQFLVHQKVIQDCGAKDKISLFLQVTMCLSNITCCLDALCYYFIAHEVRSTKHTIRRSMSGQRRATFSSSEV